MPKAPQEVRVHDKRLVDRLIRDGELDPKDHQKYLSKLPDMEKEAETLDVALEPVGDGLL